MNRRKKFILMIVGALVAGAAAIGLASLYRSSPKEMPAPTAQEIQRGIQEKQERLFARDPEMAAEFRRSHNQSNVVEQIDPKRRIRLAVGWLGLPDESKNGEASDLIVAGLSAEKNLALVDRQALEAVLRETAMSLSGLVRAQSAIQAGKLLHADWFLLGTSARIGDHSYVLARLVDARTGATRDLTAVPNDGGVPALAGELADFVRQSRNTTGEGKRNLVAVGDFRDLTPNAQQAGFANQLRGHLLAGFQGNTNVTLLERECVDLLLQEMQLDLAGLTDKSGTNGVTPMLSAMWMVDGDYQATGVNGSEVDLNVRVTQAFGFDTNETFRGTPDEALFNHVNQAIEGALTNVQKALLFPTFVTERDYQLMKGRRLSALLTPAWPLPPNLGFELSWRQSHPSVEQCQEAIRAFQTVLLLEPENHIAMMGLGICDTALAEMEPWDSAKMVEAQNYFRTVADSPTKDGFTLFATADLGWTYRHRDDAQAQKWFEKAAGLASDSISKHRYVAEAEDAGDDVAALTSTHRTPLQMAEDTFRKSVRRASEQTGESYSENMFDNFLAAYGERREAALKRLDEILPELTRKYTNIAPVLIASAFVRQTETNNPLTAQLREAAEACAAHPTHYLFIGNFFSLIGMGATDWCNEHQQFALVPVLLEAKRRAIALDPREIADPSLYPKYLIPATVKLEEVKLIAEENVALARAYAGMGRWRESLDIMESFTSLPIGTQYGGAWIRGTIPGSRSDLMTLSRQHLGLSNYVDPRIFKLADAVFGFQYGGAFTATPDGLWIAGGTQLMQVDFNFKTNRTVRLPTDGATPSSLCAGLTNLFIGTMGAGLIEYNKTTGQCRQWTEQDGLYMNSIKSLCRRGDTLWIVYGDDYNPNGAVGQLDVPTGRFTAFTPSVTSSLARSQRNGWDLPGQPPREALRSVAIGPDGNIMFGTVVGLYRYHLQEKTWERVNNTDVESIACNESAAFFTSLLGAGANSPGLLEQKLTGEQWTWVPLPTAFPQQRLSTLAMHGPDVWVGGRGFIGVVNAADGVLRKWCYTQAYDVYHIEIAGGYAWAQMQGWLYRIPLTAAD